MSFQVRYLSGRCANGAQRDQGPRYHAQEAGAHAWAPALCGARPGRTSGCGFVAPAAAQAVTCPRCLARLTRLEPGA